MQVSIVVPLFNKERSIIRALHSIVRQTFTDFEVIVVDDGSLDQSVAAAKRVKDSRIRIIEQENCGPGGARNRGAAEARGDILAFLDADDEWLPHYLDHAVRTLESSGKMTSVAVVGYRHLPGGHSTEQLWRRRGLRDGLFCAAPGMRPELMVNLVAYMSPWNTIVRRRVFEKHGGFCPTPGVRYAEDAYLWLKLAVNEAIAVSLSPPCALYHTEDSELTQRRKGPRPIEPFVTDPTPIIAAAPAELRPLVEAVLARRALKTACMLGFWGHWREAREIFSRFPGGNRRRSKYFLPAALCSTPAAVPLGRLLQTFGW